MSNDKIYIEVSGDVPQKTGCYLNFTLYDYDEVTPVSVDNISTATMVLINNDTDIEIQGSTDVKNSFNAQGVFNHWITADQNQMIDVPNEKQSEQAHVAILTITGSAPGGTIDLTREFYITIINQTHVANVTT